MTGTEDIPSGSLDFSDEQRTLPAESLGGSSSSSSQSTGQSTAFASSSPSSAEVRPYASLTPRTRLRLLKQVFNNRDKVPCHLRVSISTQDCRYIAVLRLEIAQHGKIPPLQKSWTELLLHDFDYYKFVEKMLVKVDFTLWGVAVSGRPPEEVYSSSNDWRPTVEEVHFEALDLQGDRTFKKEFSLKADEENVANGQDRRGFSTLKILELVDNKWVDNSQASFKLKIAPRPADQGSFTSQHRRSFLQADA